LHKNILVYNPKKRENLAISMFCGLLHGKKKGAAVLPLPGKFGFT
jgi:hypothetical protein